MMEDHAAKGLSRRAFLGAAAGAGIMAVGGGAARAEDRSTLKVGLVGCGRRGLGAAKDCVTANEGVVIHAIGDLFPEQVETGVERLALLGDVFQASEDHCFHGWDVCDRILETGVDAIILAAPPGFRPRHFAAAVGAGKHVFMEKPCAVDPAGVRSVLASAALAREKNLSVVAGTQRRHQAPYRDLIQRVHDGAIGEILAAECYWVGDYGYYPAVPREEGWCDTEWQIRNWNYFAWLSGDHIVEQHIHNIDVIQWALQANPVKCFGMGGRQQRTGPEYGHIFDHFAVEFEYPGGIRVQSLCRQQSNVYNRVGERLVGSRGACDPRRGITGPSAYEFSGEQDNPFEQEHRHWVDSIRGGDGLNEGENLAHSTLAAIMGRMAAYSGQEITWEFARHESALDYGPAEGFGPRPAPEVAIPGVYTLV